MILEQTMHNVQPACRSCGSVGLTPILALGKMPLSNRLLTVEQLGADEPSYPLDLMLCPKCALVQIARNRSAPTSWFATICNSVRPAKPRCATAGPWPRRSWPGKNCGPPAWSCRSVAATGNLLECYQEAGVTVLGIEPAVDLAESARQKRRVPTLAKFFNKDLAVQLEACGQPADVVHAHDVLAHVADPNGFAAGLKIVLKDTGVAVVEVPYVKDLIDNVEFDLIYHEHLCYFSLTSLAHLLARQGLLVHDVERIPTHGGSLRLYVGKTGDSSQRVQALINEEAAWGVDRARFYQSFGKRVEGLRLELMTLLRRLKSEGRRIAVYGASAKGSTLLNYFKIGSDMIDFVVDRNTSKQGRYMPGTHLKIHSPEKLMADKPDYVLLVNRDGAEEILAQQSTYRERGGRFIIPTPSVKVA